MKDRRPFQNAVISWSHVAFLSRFYYIYFHFTLSFIQFHISSRFIFLNVNLSSRSQTTYEAEIGFDVPWDMKLLKYIFEFGFNGYFRGVCNY